MNILFFLNKKRKQISKRKLDEINFELLNDLSAYHSKNDLSIDKVTWHDLDMNNVFFEANHTTTTAGEETLYYWLHNPTNNKETLKERSKHINDFVKDKEVALKLRENISSIDYIEYDYRDIIKNRFNKNIIELILFYILTLLSLISIIYTVITFDATIIPLLMIVFAINGLIHYKYLKRYNSQIDTLAYALKLLSTSKKISKLLKNIYPKMSNELDEIWKELNKIRKKTLFIFKVEGLDVIGDYMNVIFLIKGRNYLSIATEIIKHQDSLVRLYDIIGELDALLSVGIYRDSLRYYCEPIFNNDLKMITIENMYHPLLEDPITNNLETTSSIAITGSNMSGKSTFLRTIGINVLMAQSICTVLAKNYKGKFYQLITSISLNDDITSGKSYFLMEAEAIKRMVEKSNDNLPLLILIDEIFKGTNPTERLAASMEILNLLASSNTITFVATHDLQILPQLKGYEYYYFTENITEEGMDFDYKIHKGIASTRNAIKILEHLKYPDDLINKINKRIELIELSK